MWCLGLGGKGEFILSALGMDQTLSPVLTWAVCGMSDRSQNKVARTGEPDYPIGSVSIWC